MKKKFPLPGIFSSFFAVEYAVFVFSLMLFFLNVRSWGASVWLLMIPALLLYPFYYLVPSILLSSVAALATASLESSKALTRRVIVGSVAFVSVFITHLLLLLDCGLYSRYSYHINFHVLNLFTTPGGFDSMGLRSGEFCALAGGIALLALFHGALLFCFMRYNSWSFLGKSGFTKKSMICYGAGVVVFGVLQLFNFLTCSYHHYMMNPAPLRAADVIPLYINGTSSSLYRKIGLKRPSRERLRIKLSRSASLRNYPQQAILRDLKRHKYNVVWLACESWASKLYSPEIMPATTEFAKKGVTFKNHYSGGNVTRQGVFSMFYGLPGNYWHPFLAARRGPVFIDWLKEDGYSFDCITSSKFTYPEFDQTVFFQVPGRNLHSDAMGMTYERDQRNVKKLVDTIAKRADSGTPFFTFMFFESTHNPYEFPPEAEFTKDYINPFVATQVTAADGPRIFRRAANCARHLDMCLAEVFRVLKEKDLMKNTIVVIVGDHGEEFFEKNYLGHSSSFVNEQTKTTLILYYPGIKPGEYRTMSSHLDIVPMLAKFFGVRNAPKDYSCGFDLLAEKAAKRRYALIANWDEVFFAGEKYKSLIPQDAFSFAKQVITDADDRVLDDVKPFYQEYGKDLMKVQQDLTRFTAQ